MIVAFAGLPGTGKSTLARALARQVPAVILDKDPIRAALFPAGEIEYSTRQDDFCMGIVLQVAGYLLEKDPQKIIFLDGRPFTRRYQLQQVIDFCQERGIVLRIIECVCSQESALKRLDRAVQRGGHIAANRTPELYLERRSKAESIEIPHLVVNTDEPIEACLQRCREYLFL